MPAPVSKARRANQPPFVTPVQTSGDVQIQKGLGITKQEFDERAERYQYLKRKGKTFQDDA